MPVLAFVMLALGTVVAAEEPPTPATAPPVVAALPVATPAVISWIRPEEIAIRNEGLLRGIDDATPSAALRATVARIEHDLGALAPDLEGLLQHARAAVARSAPFVELDDLQRELHAADTTLAGWEKTLVVEAKRVAETLDEIARAREVWLATRSRPETVAAGDAVVRRVEGALAALDDAVATLLPWRVAVLEVGDHVLDRRAAVASALKRAQAATALEWTQLLVPGRPPLWHGEFPERLALELPRAPAQLTSYARSTFAYVRRDVRPVIVQVLIAAVLMAVFRRAMRRRNHDAAATPRPPERPYALACLLALLATPWLHPLSPQRFRQLMAIVALVPAGRIVIPAGGPVRLPDLVGLFVLLAGDRLTLALAPLPAVARVGALLTAVSGLVLASWLALRFRANGGSVWMGRALRAVVAALVVTVAAEIGGWDHLAAFLGRGIIAGAVVAVFVYAAAIGLEPMLVGALETPLLRRSHLFASDPTVMRRRVRYVLWGLGTLLWLTFVLRAIGMHAAAITGLQRLLAAGVSVGALSISVGTVLAFTLTLVAAMLIARIVTGVLEDDVYPRAQLPRGVPVVLSTLARYAVYSIGFLVALAAAGIQLNQLAILLGGLGVGIGLGLQDLVKNFAAGLTLLLERRVHPGDIVEIPGQEIFGRVVSIGMRASVVRGWNGSEFVVPNADLIATTITNWTLSDRLCRLEVPVGVAYGTDPERVLALLLEAARGDARLLATPAPQALFKGFGESSLDFVLRAWTDLSVEERVRLTSDLAVAVHRTLGAAAIVIPFPQRDLHLASVAPEVGAALARREEKP